MQQKNVVAQEISSYVRVGGPDMIGIMPLCGSILQDSQLFCIVIVKSVEYISSDMDYNRYRNQTREITFILDCCLIILGHLLIYIKQYLPP